MAWPDAFRIDELLESLPRSSVPPEVEAALLSLGFPPLKAVRKHKVSFHATYFLTFESGEGVVLQLLGSQLGDKALFHLDRPISAASIQKASLLAEEAGLRVPKVLAVGSVEAWGAMTRIPFVVYELIETRTVEDEVLAPREQLLRVIGGIKAKLCGRSLSAVDTEPLPRFEDACSFTCYLEGLAKWMQALDLVEACQKMEEQVRSAGSAAPVLVHQDLNDGNVLCSPDASGAWQLDALIDWEGACVVDARVAYEPSEPWASLRALAKVVKMRWMATAAAGAVSSLPRCCAEELVEHYQELACSLVARGWLSRVEPLS